MEISQDQPTSRQQLQLEQPTSRPADQPSLHERSAGQASRQSPAALDATSDATFGGFPYPLTFGGFPYPYNTKP